MARGKPNLISREPTDRRLTERKAESESLFQSKIPLPKHPPVELREMPAACRAWRSMMRIHAGLPADLLSGLDRDFLISYCQAVQSKKDALDLAAAVKEKYDKGQADLEDVLKSRVEARMANRLVLDYSRQMYASPKSRGGISPVEKSPSDPFDNELEAMRRLLEDGE
jgi:hypothetical protein